MISAFEIYFISGKRFVYHMYFFVDLNIENPIFVIS